MLYKWLISIMLASLVFFNTQAQSGIKADDKPKQNGFSWDRVVIDGNMFIWFNFIDISPNIGYMITDKLLAGIGVTYMYAKVPIYNQYWQIIYEEKVNIYGGRIFSRYNIYKNIFLHAEHEVLSYKTEVDYGTVINFDRVTVPALFLGAGYRQLIGSRAAFHILVLYDFIQHKYSPYSNPIIRYGFSLGL